MTRLDVFSQLEQHKALKVGWGIITPANAARVTTRSTRAAARLPTNQENNVERYHVFYIRLSRIKCPFPAHCLLLLARTRSLA